MKGTIFKRAGLEVRTVHRHERNLYPVGTLVIVDTSDDETEICVGLDRPGVVQLAGQLVRVLAEE